MLKQKPKELYYDIETASRSNIKSEGSYKYARDSSTRVLMVQLLLDDDEFPVIFDLANGDKLPGNVRQWFTDPTIEKIGANNLGFDNEVLEFQEGLFVAPEQCIDVLKLATLYNLPGNLSALAKALKLPEEYWKDEKGKHYIKLFSIPQPANSIWRKKGFEFLSRETHPEEWDGFLSYGGQDLITTRAVRRAMPRWNESEFEKAVIVADAAINRRGVMADRLYLENVIKLTAREAERLKQRVTEITGGISATQRAKFQAWINAAWPEAKLTNMQAATIDKLLEAAKDMPAKVREVLELSRMATATSVAKFSKMLDYMCDDGRLRGMFRYGGAGATMRWAGSGPQLQNITRGSLSQWEIEAFVAVVRSWRSEEDDWRLPENFLKHAQSCIRASLIPSRGNHFLDGDWSSMEGRGLAWVCGEISVLDMYREGKNLYYMNGVNMFGLNYNEISKKHPLYMVLKVTELSMGYAGGVSAFAGMAKNYRLDLDDLAQTLYTQEAIPEWAYLQAERMYHNPLFRKQISAVGLSKDVWIALDSVKRMWRRNRPKTVKFWRELEDGVRAAIDNPQIVYSAGHNGMIKIVVADDNRGEQWLYIELPSGRKLSYMWPRIVGRGDKKKPEPIAWVTQVNAQGEWEQVAVYSDTEEGDEADDEESGTMISFYAFTEAGLQKRYAHGGVFCNNVVQGLCRDALADRVLASERERWNWVMHVHDQGVGDLPVSDPRGEEEFQQFLCRLPDWASSPEYPMPIEADVDITRRFNKG